jgi:hypothetical protein
MFALIRMTTQAWDLFVRRFDTHVMPQLGELRQKMASIGRGGIEDMPNILFYGAPGFPYMPLWASLVLGDEAATLIDAPPRPTTWGAAKLPYHIHPRFFLFNLIHPDMPKDGAVLLDFLREVLPASNIQQSKHVMVIEHIDALCTSQNTHILRVLFERYSKNVVFICTTHRFCRLEPPIHSRFLPLRVPLPTIQENAAIAASIGLAGGLKTRNTSLMLWTAMRDGGPPPASPLRYPPLGTFLAKRAHALQSIRDLANTLFKSNIPLTDVILDLIELSPKPDALVAPLADLEHRHHSRKKGHDALYYELALHVALEKR